ncbi:hypothetical protein OG746_00335 [Streptomyces sp. NBC_01016]|uniref:DUF7426 family protein n=1 Tax=Streptomyces sp. NBC_01016 TaxID=2903720 RepID=UPI00224FAA00|nr:hypothetical protein [Streptomyces sp. NBC_01016]MCX4827189.1 hypothetical protein [Streptomyces sp. NBC_01016]
MAAQFEALGDFLDDWLELPVRCKDGQTRIFKVPSPPAEDGLRIDQVTTMAARLALGGAPADEEILNDDEEKDLFRLALGDAYDEIISHVAWTRFRHIAMTAVVWITSSRENAAAYWAAGGDPSLLAPNRQVRRSQTNGASASAAANTTRSRGSTSGTKAGSRRNGRSGKAHRR